MSVSLTNKRHYVVFTFFARPQVQQLNFQERGLSSPGTALQFRRHLNPTNEYTHHEKI